MKNKIIPFKGIRYNLKMFNSPEEFVCWPYDIINKKQQNEFYKKSKYNIIRLALGKERKNDDEKNNKYTRAAKYFDEWFKKGILIQEPKESFYIYRQKYTVPGTKEKKELFGFIGLIKLRDYSDKVILPHEDVLKKPLEDRFKLTVATKIQMSAIYGLYKDKANNIDNLLDDYMRKKRALITYKETSDMIHKIWKIDDEIMIKNIQSIINNKIIYIADGHHRYQTMLNFREYYRKKYNIPDNVEHPVDYILMFFVNSEHQGLTILPTHRLLYNLGEMKLKSMLKHIKDYFNLEVFTFKNKQEEQIKQAEWLQKLKNAPKDIHSFGIYVKNVKRYFLLTLQNKDAYLEMGDVDKSKTWKSLDVSIIHTLLIDHILHLTKKDISNQIYIDYTKDVSDAINKVKHDKYQAAIILNPTKIDEILKIAENGEKMPQKSTYFYPKILTGFVFNKML